MYQVNEVYRTVQGEGYWAGSPCTLIRFQGCNLRCSFCDTTAALTAHGGTAYPLAELMAVVQATYRPGDFFLLTGGEPTMQPLSDLLGQLRSLGPIHLETNGTNLLIDDWDWVTVSPKPPAPTSASIGVWTDEVKWLIATPADVLALRDWLLVNPIAGGHVFVQPISQDPVATRLCYQAALDYGWRVSLQLHKYLGVR